MLAGASRGCLAEQVLVWLIGANLSLFYKVNLPRNLVSGNEGKVLDKQGCLGV